MGQRCCDGNVVIYLYEGHQTATISDQKLLLRLEYLTDPASRGGTREAVQVALSRDEARVLGEGLRHLADAPHILRLPPCR